MEDDIGLIPPGPKEPGSQAEAPMGLKKAL